MCHLSTSPESAAWPEPPGRRCEAKAKQPVADEPSDTLASSQVGEAARSARPQPGAIAVEHVARDVGPARHHVSWWGRPGPPPVEDEVPADAVQWAQTEATFFL